MKKKHFFIAIMILVGLSQVTMAYNGSVVTQNGQTIYYNIIDSACVITRPGSSIDNPWNGFTKPSGELIIPDSIIHDGIIYPVTKIESYAFSGCSDLTAVTIPERVTYIGWSTFRNCSSLEMITLPDAITSIGEYAFYNCTGLVTVDMGDNVASIGEWAFGGCSNLASIVIPDGVSRIRDHTFRGCSNLTSVTLGSGVTYIGNCAFMGCGRLATISIPDSVTTIGGQAFNGCISLTSVTIGNGVVSLGISAFYNCRSMTSINIPAGITNIGASTFWGCSSLDSVIVPDGVITIGDASFMGCTSLTEIVIPHSVLSIGDNTFRDCSSLQSFISKAGLPPSCGSSAFMNVPSSCVLTVPCGVLSNYSNTAPWNTTFFSKVEYCPQTFIVTVLSNDSTMGTTMATTATALEGDVVTIAAISKQGYYFDHWDNGVNANPYTLNIMSDTTLTAYFSSEYGLGQEYDTVYLLIHDTIYITVHDTIFGNQDGIETILTTNVRVCVSDGYIIIKNVSGEQVVIYDAMGRLLSVKRNEGDVVRFEVPAAGSYLVKVGSAPARRIVVVK